MSLQALGRTCRCSSYAFATRHKEVGGQLHASAGLPSGLKTQNYYIGDIGVIRMVLLKYFTTRYDGVDWIRAKHCGLLHALVSVVTELTGS
jgi:hypothetical protein